MQSLVKQQGLSASGWLVVLFLAGVAITIAYAMVPAYYDNTLVVKGLKSIGSGADIRDLDKDEIAQRLRNFFDLNGVRGEPARNIKIVKRADTTLVNVDYEVRANIFANVDVVMLFENQLDISNPDACCKPLINEDK